MIWQSLEAVFLIFALIGAGVFVSWRGWVSREAAAAFPKLVINIAMPATVIASLYSHFTRRQLADAWLPLLIVFTASLLSFFLARLLAYALRIPAHRRGVFTVTFSLSNSMFIGFPVAQLLFGDPGTPYALFYYLANTVTFWLLGSYAIRRDADALSGQSQRIGLSGTLKKLAQPPLLAVLAMFAVIFSGVTLPSVLLTVARYLGNLTTPLSLIFIGCMVYGMGFSGMKWEKGLTPALLGRFVIVPALCFGLCTLGTALLAPQSDGTLMRNVFVMQISLPALMQTAITAELYGADALFAAKNVLYSTLFSLVTIPAYMLLLSAL